MNNKIIFYFLGMVIFLLAISGIYMFYPFSTSASTNPENPIGDINLEIFQGGYSFLANEEYDKALAYYREINNQLTGDEFISKNKQLILILERLQKAHDIYHQELELLNKAQGFSNEFSDYLYSNLGKLHDFHQLSLQVLIEEDHENENSLIQEYLNKKEDFKRLKSDIEKINSPFFEMEVKKNYLILIDFSLLPVEIHYRTIYLQESLTLEELENVEDAWHHWGTNYIFVINYLQDFEEGLITLEEQVIEYKSGYQDMKNQLKRLIPDLSSDFQA